MLRVWKWYQNCLAIHPVKTQVISSGFLWGTGDIAAQYITQSAAARQSLLLSDTNDKFKVNWRRVAITSMFGFGFVGPVGHYWPGQIYKLKLLLQPKSVKFVATKVAMDGIIFGPVDLFVFFSYMGLSAGKNPDQVKEDLKRDFLPALVLEGGIWPIVQVANFRYVPVRYQLLYVNIFCLIDSASLSWIEQQKDAPWKASLMNYLRLAKEEDKSCR